MKDSEKKWKQVTQVSQGDRAPPHNLRNLPNSCPNSYLLARFQLLFREILDKFRKLCGVARALCDI